MFIAGISGIIPGTTAAVVSSGGTPSIGGDGGMGITVGADNFTVNYPVTLSANDILLLHLSLTDDLGNADVSSITGGWTLAGSAYANDTFGKLYWKRATGSETGSETVTLTEIISGSAPASGVMSSWSGCISSGTPFEELTFANQGSGTNITGSAISTSGPNRRVVSFFSHPKIQTTGTNTNGWTEEYDLNSGAGDTTTMECCSKDAPSAGSVSACTRALAAAGVTNAITLALIPA